MILIRKIFSLVMMILFCLLCSIMIVLCYSAIKTGHYPASLTFLLLAISSFKGGEFFYNMRWDGK